MKTIKKIRTIAIAILVFILGVISLATPEFIETVGLTPFADTIVTIGEWVGMVLNFLIGV